MNHDWREDLENADREAAYKNSHEPFDPYAFISAIASGESACMYSVRSFACRLHFVTCPINVNM